MVVNAIDAIAEGGIAIPLGEFIDITPALLPITECDMTFVCPVKLIARLMEGQEKDREMKFVELFHTFFAAGLNSDLLQKAYEENLHHILSSGDFTMVDSVEEARLIFFTGSVLEMGLLCIDEDYYDDYCSNWVVDWWEMLLSCNPKDEVVENQIVEVEDDES